MKTKWVKGENYKVPHGMALTRFYKIWKGMKKRCNARNSGNYRNYGARGIIVCDRWNDFRNFRDDMLESYEKYAKQFREKNTTIERIDLNGNYEPKNCKTPLKSPDTKRNAIGGGNFIHRFACVYIIIMIG